MKLVSWFKKECLIRKADRSVRKGNLQAALDHIERAKVLYPDHLDIHIQRAWMLSDLKRYDEAAETIEAGLTLAPKNGILLLIRGELEYAQGKYEEARQTLHRALELTGDNLRVEYTLGLVYVALNDMGRASQFFESSVRYDKSLVESRLLAMAERYLFEHR